MDANEIEQKLGKKKAYIKKTFHVKKIGIFGSFIRGEQTPKSDIDLLVEFEKGHKDFFNYIRLKYYLEELLERKVDLVMKNAVKSRLKKAFLDLGDTLPYFRPDEI